MKRIVMLAVLGVVVVAGVFAILSAAFNPPVHSVATVRKGEASETVYATGLVEARNRRVLRAHRAAVIEQVFTNAAGETLREGSEVTAGQPILKLRDSTLESRRVQATTELERLQAQLAADSPFRKALEGRVAEAAQAATDARDREKRVAQQLASKSVSQDQYDAAKTAAITAEQRRDALQKEYDQAIADLTAARRAAAAALTLVEANERDDLIVAPLDGVILRLPLESGEFAPAGAELALVGDVRELVIEAEVNEDDIRRVGLGRDVYIRLAGYDHVKVDGQVYEILPDADRSTKGYTVRVKFTGASFVAVAGSKLRGTTQLPKPAVPMSGMTAELAIVWQKANDRLVFPRQALTADNTVFVFRDGRVTETKVQLGLVNFSTCEAVSGLSESDVVVTTGVRDLKDGMRVRAKEKP